VVAAGGLSSTPRKNGFEEEKKACFECEWEENTKKE